MRNNEYSSIWTQRVHRQIHIRDMQMCNVLMSSVHIEENMFVFFPYSIPQSISSRSSQSVVTVVALQQNRVGESSQMWEAGSSLFLRVKGQELKAQLTQNIEEPGKVSMSMKRY